MCVLHVPGCGCPGVRVSSPRPFLVVVVCGGGVVVVVVVVLKLCVCRQNVASEIHCLP